MKKFAYYMCFKCSQPYFGGLRSCEQEDQELRDVQSDEMVCGGCSVSGDQSCPTHGLEAIEYKCKFCCSVASWFCWGTTHFCDSCHRYPGFDEPQAQKGPSAVRRAAGVPAAREASRQRGGVCPRVPDLPLGQLRLEREREREREGERERERG
ncbi:hypothetical protein T484DRAFT_3024011 [Baffinella frigidus]|nr:hypothetical protein T484DRAFT_3024011 [Cryptophyta sp. CCMP2293]